MESSERKDSRTRQIDEELAKALSLWSQGNQQGAVDLVQPLADEGDGAALLAISWFFQNMGRASEGIPYAKRAALEGDPWVLQWYFPLLADNQATREDAAAMIAAHPLGGLGSNDPLGRSVEFASSNEAQRGVEMLRAAAGPHGKPPLSSEEIERLTAELERAVGEVTEKKGSTIGVIDEAGAEVRAKQADFETKGKTLGLLMQSVTEGSVRSYFDKRAKSSAKSSVALWSFGVLVLLLAACAAFLPLILNYIDDARELKGQSSVSAHLGATLALAAVAGVLLARARSRDKASQQSHNLSVALGTVYTYSEQMSNEEDKERFKHDMTRLVLENFLDQKPDAEERSRNLLSDIAGGVGPRQPQ